MKYANYGHKQYKKFDAPQMNYLNPQPRFLFRSSGISTLPWTDHCTMVIQRYYETCHASLNFLYNSLNGNAISVALRNKNIPIPPTINSIAEFR